MKNFFKIFFLCLFIFGTFVGLMELASWSIYRQDVRRCVSDDAGSESACEQKFK